ncbi:hypothetical protein [Gordonia phthalatica]|uniref:Uncharacterized protein n=1 Tax=Gordonia phthalatica TaxID=1136941 RepID=A0A0N9NG46_9ACTN|nr:hypothetical protein [Gordonia phthalatica]ALG84308.1 hypothetical protein ACH46_07085 [Gordonia phthalatica]
MIVTAHYFTGLLSDRTDDWGTEGSGYAAAVLAWGLAMFGFITTFLAVFFLDRERPSFFTPVAALITVVVGVATIGLSPVGDGSLRTAHGELTELADSQPHAVRAPGRVVDDLTVYTPITLAGYLSGGMVRTAETGDKTADIVMHNFADSSVRWRLKVPGDIYDGLSMRAYEGSRYLVVTTRIGTTFTT